MNEEPITKLLCPMLLVFAGCVSAPADHADVLDNLDAEGTQLSMAGEGQKPGEPLTGTRDNYIEHALRQHPELTASYQRWRAAALNVDAVGTWPEPVITYGYFIQSVETRVGPQRHKFGVRQPIPWPTKLSAGKRVAGARAKTKKAQFDAKMLMVRKRVSELYWKAWLVGQVRHWQTEQLSLLEAMSESLRVRLETGRVQLSDLNQVALRISRIRDRVSGLDEREVQLKAMLLASAGEPHSVEAPIDNAAPIVPSEELNEKELVAQAQAHPRIRAALAAREMNELKARRAGLDAMPDFSLGVDYVETGISPMSPAPEGNGKDPIMAMVGIKVPLWFGDYAAGRDSAHAEALAAAATAQAIRDELAAAIRADVSRLRDARRRVKLYQEILIPQAEAAYGSVLSGYEAGTVQVAAVLFAQRELIELRLGTAQALADVGIVQAAIEQLTAQPIR